ncbi:MAG: cytidine deaminase, partial [Clostridiales bacterium]|nr:cytidine deaminase [Clostridiales bacterium]
MDIKKLVSEAKSALQNAYAPYSDFKVGAAL